MEDRLSFSCDLKNGLFTQNDSGEKIGLDCEVKTSQGNSLGNVSISYKSINGKAKLDFNMSKSLIGNLISDGLNLESIISSLGNIFT